MFNTKELDQVWEKTLDTIKDQLSNPSFKTWFSDTSPLELTSEGLLKLKVPNDFIKDWIESRYTDLIIKTITELTDTEVELKFFTPEEIKKLEQEQKNKNKPESESRTEIKPVDNSRVKGSLNPKYTFETFVVGSSNRFAHAASLAVAEAPAKAYNPLFLYGDVGL